MGAPSGIIGQPACRPDSASEIKDLRGSLAPATRRRRTARPGYSILEYPGRKIKMQGMARGIYQKDHKRIVTRLRQARAEAGLGQAEVARELGRTQSFVSKLESGQRKIDVLQLKDLARLYRKPLDYFLK